MAQNITLLGAQYNDVPAVQLPKTGGGTARFDDASITTAVASDVTQGKVFLAADGTITTGTNSGGGGSSNDFIVTLTKDQDDVWQPDKTYAEVYAAYSAGKTIAWLAVNGHGAYGRYNATLTGFEYVAYEYLEDETGDGLTEYWYIWTANSIESGDYGNIYYTDLSNAVPSDVASGKTFYNYDGRQTGTAGASVVKTATGTFTGNGTRTISVACTFEPDLIYVNSDPGTSASSGTVAIIIARDMMTATNYRNNSASNSHYAIPNITNMNTGGSSYSWRATYGSGNVTLYCFSSSTRALLTSGRTYSYTFIKWT